MLYGRLVRVGKTFNRFAYFWAVNCTQKSVSRPGSARTRWRSYSTPIPPNRYKGKVGRKGEERVGNRERGREEKDVKG